MGAGLSEPHFKRLPAFLAVLSYLVVAAAVVADFTIIQPGSERDRATLAPVEETAAGWLIDMEKSRLEIQIIQMGNPVTGGFNTWNADRQLRSR